MFSFLNNEGKALVLFSKLVRVSEPKPLRVRVRVYMYTYTARRRHQKTAKKGAVALFKPYKAATRHFTGAIDRFYIRHFFVSYRRVYGRGSAWEGYPHTPPRYQREWQGVHFQPAYIGDIEQGV